jgi:hypothetical protein
MSATSRGEFGGCKESTARYTSFASDIVMPVAGWLFGRLLQHIIGHEKTLLALICNDFKNFMIIIIHTLPHRSEKSSFHSKNLQGCVVRPQF